MVIALWIIGTVLVANAAVLGFLYRRYRAEYPRTPGEAVIPWPGGADTPDVPLRDQLRLSSRVH